MGYDYHTPLNKHANDILHYKKGKLHSFKNSNIFPVGYISLTQHAHLRPLTFNRKIRFSMLKLLVLFWGSFSVKTAD